MKELTHIKQILSKLKPELAGKFHVSSIGLFGSIVRNDFNSSSDIDIIVDFSEPIGIEFVDLADFIEKELNNLSWSCHADSACHPCLHRMDE